MDKKIERLTSLIKGRVKNRPTFGTEPNDPWSTKAGITEDSTLDSYLKAKGIDPMRVSAETKISHSKSGSFAKWKQDRKFSEEVEQVDEKIKVKVSTDKPIGFKVADIGPGKKEYNVKTDKVWDDEQKKKTQKEEVEQIDEDELLNKYLKTKGLNPKTASKISKIAASKTGDFDKWKRDHIRGGRLPEEITSEQSVVHTTHSSSHLHTLKSKLKLNRRQSQLKPFGVAGPGLRREDVDKKDAVTMDIPLLIRMLELAREDLKSDADLHKVVEKLINIRKKGILTMSDYEFVSNIKEQYFPEDTYQDSYAATQTTGPEATSTDDTEKNQTDSKAAKLIKSLKKKVNEDLYDHEKEDKSVASYGKKPKIDASPIDPKAAGIIYGGKTLTGQSRDTIELDPLMKKPNVQPDFAKKANLDKKITNDK